MCGVTGIISLKHTEIIKKQILESLHYLQNRGYDSSGVSILTDSRKFHTSKGIKQENESIFDKIEKDIQHIQKAYSIIGHNRWATHGGVTETNAHPHLSFNKKICIVHNGIFENYDKWKMFLETKNIYSVSQTDSEVIANLIAYFLKTGSDIENVLGNLHHQIEGTFALIIQYNEFPNKLYALRKGSPLLIGKSTDTVIVTSEKSGFMNVIRNYIVLESQDICTILLNKNNVDYKTKCTSYINYDLNNMILEKTPGTFPHWTIKEIHEQQQTFFNAINYGGRLSFQSLYIKLGGLLKYKDQIIKSKTVILLGCGTSLHAAEYIKRFVKSLNIYSYIYAIDGSEFDEYDIPNPNDTIAIMISQSGETTDLYRCFPMLKTKKILTIGVINVVDSLIAREVDCGIYCNAGREVAVGSTKSFFSQILILILFMFWVDQERHLENINKNKPILLHFLELSEQINTIFEESQKIRKIAENLKNCKTIFILGKGIDEIIAKEASLKIKELTYIHAEAYNASSLKHGPFALLDENVPVILLLSNVENLEKIKNCYYEIRARNANVFVFSTVSFTDNSETVLIPDNKYFSSLLNIIPLQLLAYYISVSKNINPDKPRNLAKVVTVE